eukprot:TRINITY_DN10716_c0_g1_i1.p1 TRINITY_DN10716_c0_g1~~TRINITY_DN10716_c0_g1_i1.p1  ORF type:complete len:355 (-),score=42.31 TRINITY_DN10716_c0_g1_i1:45-1082(-)
MERYFSGLLTIILVFCVCSSNSANTCKDDSGKAVDWWVAYKLPKIKSHPNPIIVNGLGFAYMDSNHGTFTISSKSMEDKNTFIANTLNSIYNGRSTSWVMWNDDPPGQNGTTSRAHAKGVLGFSSVDGFYLRHSIPNFPPRGESSYSYPDSGTNYGQTLLCLSMSTNQLDKVAQQFLINGPEVYSYFLTGAVSKYSGIAELVNGNFDKYTLTSALSLNTKNGMKFIDFAKSKYWDDDLYENLVSTNLSTSLLVETWGRPLMQSYCKPAYKYNVVNIDHVGFDSSIVFKETKDHAKWAISPSKTITCIGDINRMTSQRKRGGGTTCTTDSSIYQAFKKLVVSSDSC